MTWRLPTSRSHGAWWARGGGCSAADLEQFAKEDGDDPLELAALLLSGAMEHMAVLLEVIGDGMGDHPQPRPR